MYIGAADRSVGEEERRPVVESQGFGHFIAPRAPREFAVVVPTQFVLAGGDVLPHFAPPQSGPRGLAETLRAMLAVAGDWAFVSSDWKVVGDEHPNSAYLPPATQRSSCGAGPRYDTTRPASRTFFGANSPTLQPGTAVADPFEAPPAKLKAIRTVVLTVEDVSAKIKYGGNVDGRRRRAVIERLRERGGPGDPAGASHSERRLGPGDPDS